MTIRDDLRGRRERRFDTVQLPDDGPAVRIRSLTEAERTRYEFATSDEAGRWTKKNATKARAFMLALSIVDEEGKVTYDPDNAGDLAELQELDSRDASLIYAACLTLNHASGGSVETIEETAKNSEDPTA